MQVTDLHLYVKCHYFTGVFHTFCLCISLPALSINGSRKRVKQQTSRVSSQLTLIDLHILRKVIFGVTINTGAIPQRCSEKKVCCKNAANLQEKTHAEVDFNTKLQSNFIEITRKHRCFLVPKFTVFFQNTFL